MERKRLLGDLRDVQTRSLTLIQGLQEGRFGTLNRDGQAEAGRLTEDGQSLLGRLDQVMGLNLASESP